MPLLHHRDRIEGDLVIEVAFTDVSLSLGDAADDAVRADALAQVARETGAAPVLMHQVHGADRRVRRVRRGARGARRRATPSSPRSPASPSWPGPPTASPSCWPTRPPGGSRPCTAAGPGSPGESSRQPSRPSARGAATRRSPGSGPTCAAPATRCPPTCRSRSASVVPEARSTTSWGTPGLDLGAGVRAQLAAAGIDDVRTVDACTREDASWPSYRRDGDAATRFAGVIWSHR